MHDNVVLQNVFGTIATILWSGQIIPQIWKNFRRKSTHGLSANFMLLWGLASISLGIYNISQDLNIALIVQPQTFGVLSFLCWVQCLHYGSGYSLTRCSLTMGTCIVAAVGIQVAMVFALRDARDANKPGVDRGVQFFGLMATALLSLGLAPQYLEIFRLKQVVGLSYTFIAIDLMGGVFALLSLAFKAKWDVIASIAYSLVVLLDGGVLLLALILSPLARKQNCDKIEHIPVARTVESDANVISHALPSILNRSMSLNMAQDAPNKIGAGNLRTYKTR